MAFKCVIFIAVVVAVLLNTFKHVPGLVYRLGFHKHVYSHVPGHCRIVPGIAEGAEDIHLLPSESVIFSSGLRFVTAEKKEEGNGSMYLYDFLSADKKPEKLAVIGLEVAHFEPHGLDIWVHPQTGQIFVYVVSHGPDLIIKFKLDEEKKLLEALHIFDDPAFMINLNDVSVVDEDKFYFTNLFGTSNDTEDMVWAFKMMRPTSFVTFYENGHYKKMLTDYFMMNGLVASADRSKLYVASWFAVNVFAIEVDNSLTPVKTFSLESSPDNLFLTEKGDILVGTQPLLHEAFARATKGCGAHCSSQVLHIAQDRDRITSLYADNGVHHNCSTGAVQLHNVLLIGSIDQTLMRCILLPDDFNE